MVEFDAIVGKFGGVKVGVRHVRVYHLQEAISHLATCMMATSEI
jgi:hypothetical protein